MGAEEGHTPVAVALIDDDPLVRSALQLMLRQDPGIEVVAEGSDGADVLRVLNGAHVDVLVMDVRMRRLSGVAAIPAVKTNFPHTKVLLMTSFSSHTFAEHLSNTGADAFIAKEATVGDFIVAIRRLAPTAAVAAAPMVQAAEAAPLSPREAAVMQMVADGLSNPDIADRLGLSVNSVKTYVSRVFTKLGVENRVQVANLVRSHPGQIRTGSSTAVILVDTAPVD